MNQSSCLSPFQPPKKDGAGTLAAPVNLQGDLIDLNTPKDDKGFAQSDVCRPKVFPHQNNMTGVLKDDTCNIEKDGIVNSESVETLSGGSMIVSHTESGYLTESITSSTSRDRHPSVGSEADKTPCYETHPVSSSDTTPCHENVDSITRQFEQTKFAPDGANAPQGLVKSKTDSGIANGVAFAKLDFNCDMKNADIGNIFTTNNVPPRPESLILTNSIHKSGKALQRSDSDSFRYAATNKYSSGSRDYRLRSKSSGVPIPRLKEGVNILEEGLSKSLPQGQIIKGDAGLIEFIADDLVEKIRRSSPASITASSVSSRRSSLMSDSMTSVDSFASSTMATSMTSGMSRSYPQSPDCIPPIDPMAIHEIENQARLVADSLDHMMGNLKSNLHKMSAISVGCEEAYRTSVDVTCDSVDSSIKSMYALMAKCEELSSTMKPIYALADQIKEIKRLLDRFENQLVDKP